MSETRAVANLPNLNIEIRHREVPEEGAEYLSITMRATPDLATAVSLIDPFQPDERRLRSLASLAAPGRPVRLLAPPGGDAADTADPGRMIRHIVLFSVKDPAELATIQAALSRLAEIPDARRLEVARNSKRDGLSAEIDLVVYGEFPDYAALDRYKAHPLYAETIAVVRPRRELRIAVDFEAFA